MLTVNESILTNCCYFLPFAFQLWSPARPTSLTLSQKAREQTFGSHSPKQHSTQKALVVSHFEEQDWITVSCHLSTLGHSLFSGESESESSHPASRVRAPPPHSALDTQHCGTSAGLSAPAVIAPRCQFWYLNTAVYKHASSVLIEFSFSLNCLSTVKTKQQKKTQC